MRKNFTRFVHDVSQCQKNLLDFRQEKNEMKIEEGLILYLLKRNKAIFL